MATDKREYILDVAERLFAEQGFEAVSIRSISKEAHINIAMISYYFGSKEKLYEEIINRKLIPFEKIKQMSDTHASYFDKLMFIADVIVDKFFESRNFQILVFREMNLNQRTHMADFLIEHMQRNFLFISDIIKKGIRKKEFKNTDVDFTVMTLFAIIRMYTTSGMMICKLTNKASIDEVYDAKQKTKIKKFISDLFSAHLLTR
ncbi:MAG: TetR/AcrR family transcriptional regulator [Bacteroidota bacterium]|nr:TetR/AcrR family transcriptional regulator [Bacteroidota bacterium]